MKLINESKGVTVYKKLLRVLADYSHRFPATGVDRLFQSAVDNGMKIMPKDKVALDIINYILHDESPPAAVQKLLNTRFTSLLSDLRPIIKGGRRKEVAFWMTNDRVGDKVIDLINFTGSGRGYWTDVNGGRVTIVDMSVEEEK